VRYSHAVTQGRRFHGFAALEAFEQGGAALWVEPERKRKLAHNLDLGGAAEVQVDILLVEEVLQAD
jgi:hypothetical protein